MPTPIEAKSLQNLPGIAHGFFSREGGVSQGLYASLNCGLGSKDDAAHVTENRDRVARHLGAAPGHVITPFQIHSAKAVVAEAPWTRAAMPQCDAIVTRARGLAIGVLAADCAPVLLADSGAGVVAAAHAGWRGAIDGVTDAAIAAMLEQGARRHHIVAAVGPCIGQPAYEVGPEFEQRFLAHHPANEQFFTRPSKTAKPRFDLGMYVVTRLRLARIARIDLAAHCTFTNESLFFSFRRAQALKAPDYGRQISAICLR